MPYDGGLIGGFSGSRGDRHPPPFEVVALRALCPPRSPAPSTTVPGTGMACPWGGRRRRRLTASMSKYGPLDWLIEVPCLWPFLIASVALQLAAALASACVLGPLGHLVLLALHPCGVRRPTNMRKPKAVATERAVNPLGGSRDGRAAPTPPPLPAATQLPGLLEGELFKTIPKPGVALYLNTKSGDLLLPGDVLRGRLTGYAHARPVEIVLVCVERLLFANAEKRIEFYVVATRTVVNAAHEALLRCERCRLGWARGAGVRHRLARLSTFSARVRVPPCRPRPPRGRTTTSSRPCRRA